MNPSELEVNVWFDQHLLPSVKILLDLQQQLLLCTIRQRDDGITHLNRLIYSFTSWTIKAFLPTIGWYPQKESVGDVKHGAAKQTQDVHLIQTFQIIQVCLHGGVANPHCVLYPWACQGWQKKKKDHVE